MEIHVALLLFIMVGCIISSLSLYLNAKESQLSREACHATYITMVWDLVLVCRVCIDAVSTCVTLNNCFSIHFTYLERLRRRVHLSYSGKQHALAAAKTPAAPVRSDTKP